MPFPNAHSFQVAGTLSKRCHVGAYLVYSVTIAAFVYPAVVHSISRRPSSEASLPPPWPIDAGYISVRKDKSVKAPTIPNELDVTAVKIPVHKVKILGNHKVALYASKVCSYAQGRTIIKGCRK